MKRGLVIAGLAACAAVAAQVGVAQTITPLDTLRVEDQNGRYAGLAEAGGAGFFLKAGDSYVRISVARDRFNGTSNGVWFESGDCSGQPLLQVYPEQFVGYSPSYVGPAPTQTLFARRVGATPTTVVVNSFNTGEVCNPRAPGPGLDLDVVPVDPYVDFGPLFTPPFRLAEVTAPAAGCCGDCDGNGEVAINELLTGVGSALDGCSAK